MTRQVGRHELNFKPQRHRGPSNGGLYFVLLMLAVVLAFSITLGYAWMH